LELWRVQALSRSPEETRDIGRTLGENALAGHVFALNGALGAGKTCLAQGVLWGLGGDEYARSPTFVLITEYQARLSMYHIDLYRIEAPEEVFELGLDEYLYGNGVCVVEWADRAPGQFPNQHLNIRIEPAGHTTRRLTITATGPDYLGVMNAVKSRIA
jgi:tRNA threonylcarbamoyladenosine biosynthesis protein TsaE